MLVILITLVIEVILGSIHQMKKNWDSEYTPDLNRLEDGF